MKRFGLSLMALVSLAACHLGTGARGPASSGADASMVSFTVAPLSDADINIQGCSRTLNRAGAGDTIFAEDAVDSGAKGFIRVDGQLIDVTLTSASGDEHHGTRNFADANHSVEIVEILTTGAAHEASDSVEESGTLAVTRYGATQTIQVEGGVAC